MYLTLRMLLAGAASLGWQLILKPQPAPLAMQIWLLGCVVLPLFGNYRPFRHIYPRQVLAFWLWLGIAGLVWLLLIVPYSAYMIWLGLFRLGLASGTISFSLIHLPLGLSGLALAGLEKRNTLAAIALYVMGNSLAVLLLFPRPLLLGIFGAAGALYLITTFIQYDQAPEKKETPKLPRRAWRGALNLALATGLSLGISQAAGGGEARAGSPLIDRTVSSLLRAGTRLLLPNFPLLYSEDGQRRGQGLDENSQGGAAVLSQRPQLRLDAPAGRVYYLRTRIFEAYDSLRWLPPGSATIATDPIPEIESGQRHPAIFDHEELLELTILDDYFAYLPHTADTVRISISQAPAELDTLGLRDSSYRLATPLARGSTVRLQAAARPPLQPGEDDLRRYLQVPAGLAADLDGLRTSLLAGLEQPDAATVARRLADHFGNGYAYTLQPENDKSSEEFITNFLFATREGYCVHYAGAAVLLARLCGIPARYVSGYLAIVPHGDEQDRLTQRPSRALVTLSGLNAHAWAEFWIPGSGWVSQEFTPAIRTLTAGLVGGSPESAATGTLGGDTWTRRQLATLLGTDLSPAEQPAHQQPLFRFVVIALAIAVSLLLVRPSLRRKTDRGKARLLPNTPARTPVQRQARRLVRLAWRHGIQPPCAKGWLGWAADVCTLLEHHPPNGGCTDLPPSVLAGNCGRLLSRHFYTPRALNKAELDQLHRLRKALKIVAKAPRPRA